MIRLYQFQRGFGLPNLSPFCMRVETYLRMAALPYEAVCDTRSLKKAPKGKLPFIEDQGKTIGDSGFIITYLKNTYGDPLDAGLTAEQRATAHALQRMLCEHLYWVLVYSRWLDPEHWPFFREILFKPVPGFLRKPVAAMIRRKLARQFYGHGMGRHTRDEIYSLGVADVEALADFLGEKTYFLGDKPSSLDATAYAFLAGPMQSPIATPLSQCAQSRPALVAYCERMRAAYYADLAGA